MRLLPLATVSLSLALSSSAALARQTAASDSATARVDRLFASWATPDSPGCAVGVSRDGRTVLARAYGMANLEYSVPNTPATIFEAGSVSKQFTAAAVLLLAREGKLTLNDDIRAHFPELPDYGATIRIRHMLNHTSGLRDWGTVAAASGWPRGNRAHTQEDVLRIIARQKSLNFTPGSEYLYSNSNYNLLAMLVARVSEMSFAEYTRRNIFQPLGMTSTSWRDDFTRVVKNRATAYDREDGGGWRMDMPFENAHGNGGLLTTVEDLLRWNRNFSDTTVGGARFATDMQQRGRLNSGSEIRYAMGLSVDRYRGLPEVSHSGATAGYRAFLVRYPEQRLGVAVLCNAGNASTTTLARQVAEIHLADAIVTAASDSTAMLEQSLIAGRVGLYRSERDNSAMRIEPRNGGLAVKDGPPLTPLSPTIFRIGTGSRRLVFVTDASGAVRALEPTADGDTTRYVRVQPWAPTAGELTRFAGTFTSEEAESTIRVVVDSGRLVVHAPRATPLRLSPLYRDAFLADDAGYVFRFHRNARGMVVAVGVNLGRARDLRFTKTR